MTGFIDLNATDLYYDSTGTGPAVFFIHAGVADSRMWNNQWSIEGFSLIRFDMRGFGQSGVGSDPFTNHDDALDVLDHLDVQRAVIVGCSIGARAAMQMVKVAPERVAGLVLVGADAPGYDPGIDYESPEWPEVLRLFEAGDLDRVARLEAEMWLAGIGRSTTEMDDGLVELFIDMDLIALRNETEQEKLEIANPLDALPTVNVPALIIVGKRDLPQKIAEARYLAENLSDRPAEILPDTAHLPSMDQPEAFNTLLSGFLPSIDEFP